VDFRIFCIDDLPGFRISELELPFREEAGLFDELLKAAMPQSSPTPDRERTRGQRQQQQTSAMALKPTAMRATMWPLLLPDAVCMARSLTELLSMSCRGLFAAVNG
jgi:hypothetical protein